MKKTLKILLLFIMIFTILCGCDTQDSDSKRSKKDNTKKEFDAEEVISQLEIKEYTTFIDGDYFSEEENSIYLIIENKSDFNIVLNTTVKTYDENKNVKNVITDNIPTVAAKTKVVVALEDCGAFKTFEYTFTANEFTKKCGASELDCVITEGEKIFATVTNNSSVGVRDLDGYMFYFNNNELISVERESFDDSNYKLDAQETLTKEYSRPSNCTDYEFVLFGDW